MILKTSKARFSITQKDLSKAFKGPEYKEIEFIFKNTTFSQELELMDLYTKIQEVSKKENDSEILVDKKGIALMLELNKFVLTNCLVDIKGFKDEEGNELSLTEDFINDLTELNFSFAQAVVEAFLDLKQSDKKK